VHMMSVFSLSLIRLAAGGDLTRWEQNITQRTFLFAARENPQRFFLCVTQVDNIGDVETVLLVKPNADVAEPDNFW